MGITNVQYKDLIQASPLVGKTVRLTEGQVVTGKVLNITDKGAVISLAGTKILAKTAVNLQEGSTIRAKIELASEDQIVLRVLDQKTSQPVNIQSVEDADIEHVLLKLGLGGDGRTFEAAKALLSAGVAVTPGNLEKLLTLMQKFHIESSSEAKALALMMGRNLPVSKISAEILQDFLAAPKLGDLLGNLNVRLSELAHLEPFKQLAHSLDVLAATLKFDSPTGIESGLKALLKELSYSLPADILTQSQIGAKEINGAVKELAMQAQQLLLTIDRYAFKQMGLSGKAVLDVNNLLGSLIGTEAPDKQSIAKLINLLPELIAKMSKINIDTTDKLSGILFKLSLFSKLMASQGGVNGPASLSENLVASQDVLKSVFSGQSRAVDQLSESMAKIASNVSAQQMLSSSLDTAPAPLNIMYIQLPYKVDEQFRTLEIAIQGDETQAKKIDPDNTSVNLFLSMPNLGDLAISLKIEDGNLDGRFIVQDISAKNAVDSSIDLLEDNLSDKIKGKANIDSLLRDPEVERPGVDEILMPVEARKMDMYI